jgi:TRAP-type C4-dicarboxylate transport system permease small subunit
MADGVKTGAGATSPHPDRGLAGWWSRGVDGLAALGSILIVILMAMICADVLARNIAGASLPLIPEAGALTVVLIVFLQLGAAVRNDRLASTEFVMEALAGRSPRAAAVLRAAFDMVGAAICAGVAWASWGILANDFAHGEFIGIIGIATMPTSPFRARLFLGATVAAIQFVLMAARRLRGAAATGATGS